MEFKKAKCINCGKEIKINKRASINNCKCDICKNQYKHICKNCGQEFIGTHNQVFCSKQCKTEFHIIPTLIKYFNFDITKQFSMDVHKEIERIKNILYNEYWVEHHSSSEICKKYNYPNIGNLTAKLFVYLGITSKTLKESNNENYLYGRMPINSSTIYNQQWHTTWNNKEVFLRSSYELDYAKELDEKQIDYEVEFKHIKYWDSQKQDYRCAIPDFYIPSQNLIVEIKSEYTLDKQNMKDKFKAYKELGYNVKLICDHKELIL